MLATYYEEELRKAYQKGIKWVNMKAVPKKDCMEVRIDITRQIDKALLVSGNVYFTEGEKDNILYKGKAAYKAYCAFMKAHPEENTEQLKERAEELVDLLVRIENERVMRFYRGLKEDEYLDLEKVFTLKQYVQSLMNHPVTFVIENAIKNKNLGAIGTHKLYYSTRAGKRFHLEDCPYCSGKILCADTETGHIDSGKVPCECIKRMRKKEIEEVTHKDHYMNYMTAYVDESIRANPGYIIDKEQDKDQNLLSVILCKGKIKKEDLVTKGNTVTRFVSVAKRTSNLLDTTLEAIGEALLKAAATGFDEHMIIFTDNKSACEEWKKRKELQLLAGAFKTVRVQSIDRGSNTKADALIRQNDLMLLPRKTMDKVVKLYNKVQSF